MIFRHIVLDILFKGSPPLRNIHFLGLFHSSKVYISECMMVNFFDQCNWAKGCVDILSNSVPSVFCEGVSVGDYYLNQ